MTAPETAAATIASPERTRALLEAGTALRWWQVTSFLEVAGPDAATLLDGLCTQAVERIEPGTAVLGLFLDAKAKIIAPAILHRLADAPWHDSKRGETVDRAPRLLLETPPELVEPLRSHLSRYRLRARTSIEPSNLGTVALVGGGLPIDPKDPSRAPLVGDGEWTSVRDCAHPTLAFIGSVAACSELVRGAATDGGIELADPDAFEADRIERRVASLHDLLVGRMPAEVGGMERAVALDAGCYLGQEPVARLHYRGRSNRTLRRVDAAGPITPPTLRGVDDEPPALDDVLALRRTDAPDDARPVGRLTTWAPTADGRCVALAVLRREVAAGESLRLGDNRSLVAVDAPVAEPTP